MKKTGAVLAAAGLSSRMKAFKPMLPFGGTTISRHLTALIKSLGVDPVVVVTGYRGEELESHLSATGVRFVRNERFWETQMFESVKFGIQSVLGECERVLIMPMDLPAIQPETFEQVLNTEGRAVRTSCAGEPGHPLIVDVALAGQLCRYKGEGGLRGAIEHSGVPVTEVEVDEVGVFRDVDTGEEYQKLLVELLRQDSKAG